jgi:hypothetical protein
MEQDLRQKSPIQHQKNYKSQEQRNADQNFPILIIPGHGKSSDRSRPILFLARGLSKWVLAVG